MFVSLDDGDRWQPLQNNLPHAPVYGITVQPRFGDLVIATYGRGFWILDDISPLREASPDALASAAKLFTPRPAYRFRGVTPPAAPSFDEADGRNPSYGADINYYLQNAAAEEPQITIVDDKGRTVRTLRGSKNAGVNRVWWDLRYAPSGTDVRLRTAPLFASWMKVPEEGRPGGGRMQMLAPPGTYSVKLAAGAQELTQPLVVLKDPHSGGSDADIQTQFAFVQSLRQDMDRAAAMVNRAEALRRQLEDLAASSTASPAVKDASADLDRKLTDFEDNLYQLRLTGGQDGMRWGGRLIQKLGHLASEVQESDYRPTDQQVAVRQQFATELATLQSRLDRLTTEDVSHVSELLKENNLPPLRDNKDR